MWFLILHVFVLFRYLVYVTCSNYHIMWSFTYIYIHTYTYIYICIIYIYILERTVYYIYMKYVVKHIDQIHQTCCNCFGPHPATRCTTWTLVNAVPGEISPLGLAHLAFVNGLRENRQYRKPWLFPWNIWVSCICFPKPIHWLL